MENEIIKKGRPKKFNSAEEMQEKIDNYFSSCFIIKYDDEGNIAEMKRIRAWTMSGLADALDMSRQSLINYSKDDEFFDTITRARRKIEIYNEEMIYSKEKYNGARFSLENNFGWKENKSVEHSGEIKTKRLEDLI